jgi:hypothetical protein
VHTGAIAATSIYNTWLEQIECWSADDDTLYDLSSVVEITLKLRDEVWRSDELTLTMTGGAITIPSQGIVQWRAEQTQMMALAPKTYELVLTLQDATDTVTLILGHVSLVE